MAPTLQDFHELFGRYEPTPSVYDEFSEEGELRQRYQTFVSELDGLGRIEFSRRWTQARRAVRDNGIAFSGQSGKTSRPRFWTLDALPVLIPADEWARIQAAVEQRATLLGLVLRDLYGPQKLIKDGVVPRELIYSDPGFLRSCRNLVEAKGHGATSNLASDFLHLYAADIARAPNGKWWILGDRTEAPSGLGYALEHRIVMSRMLPGIFRESRTRRLAPFFVTLQNRLQALASHNRDNPRIVLLSDGPVNPYHLEDAYLSRYLGYLLVEDGDLAVRGSKVMLKTLGGLQPIDVVIRHQNSNACDPLEYNTVSGVAGLTQSVRANEVAIANQIGSGLVESTAYMAFSVRLCKAVLGEEPMLPNVATWWCGEESSLKFVLDNLDRLVVQPAFRNRGRDETTRRELQSLTSARLAERIRANPRAYVAQEVVERSSVPIWGQRVQSGRLAIRTYAVSEADSDSFQVMDGGLGRVTKTLEPLEISIRKGEISKDIWVLSDKPVEHVTLLAAPGDKTVVRRSGANLPSRVADNLFWLGRRMERTEAHARLIGITARRLIGELSYEELEDMSMLLRCLASEGLIEPGYAMTEMRLSLPNVSVKLPGFLLSNQPDSLASGIRNLVRLGYLVRDRLSVQAWRIILQIEGSLKPQKRKQLTLADIVEITDNLQTLLAAFAGIVIESMTRTQVFQFLDLGRRMERAQQILGILNQGIMRSDKPARIELETTLDALDSLMTYRSRYLAQVHEVGVVDLLVKDETNPRSLAYQVHRMKQHIEQLPRTDERGELSPEVLAVGSLLNDIRMLDLEGNPEGFGEDHLLDGWEKEMIALANSLSHRYLVHAKSQQLTDSLAEEQPADTGADDNAGEADDA